MVLALGDFLQCAKDRQRHLRKHWDDTARKVRFSRLSDDVLAMIFEFASSSDSNEDDRLRREYYKTPRLLSQVSRRFRYIALSTPRLWSVLDSGYQSVEEAQRLLARNGTTDSPLTVHMQNITEPGWSGTNMCAHFLSFFDLVGTLSTRLSRLHFHIRSEMADELFGEFDSSFSDPRKLCFPSLQMLELAFEDAPQDYWDPHFYGDWDLPALETLRLCNIIPQFRPKRAQWADELHVTFWEAKTVQLHRTRENRQGIGVPKHPSCSASPRGCALRKFSVCRRL